MVEGLNIKPGDLNNHADWTISIRDYTIVWLTIAKITTWLNMIWNHMPQETY
jgi:hypothetical protein